jgi:hypothetical protein
MWGREGEVFEQRAHQTEKLQGVVQLHGPRTPVDGEAKP